MGGGYYLLPLPRTLVNTTEVSTDFYRRVQVEDTTYYFNPHFTCWVSEGSEAPEAPSEIGIRTARQLNNLSLYYEQYSPLLAKDTTLPSAAVPSSPLPTSMTAAPIPSPLCRFRVPTAATTPDSSA